MGDSASGTGRHRVAHMGLWLIACLILTGCVFQDVRKQQEKVLRASAPSRSLR